MALTNSPLVIVMGQFNITVGDITHNAKQIIQLAQRAQTDYQADLIVFPELALSGYLAEDLMYRTDFLQANADALAKIQAEVINIDIILGHLHQSERNLYNASSYIHQGKIQHTYYKQLLPNYGVFDEQRYFTAGTEAGLIQVKGYTLALTICEDLWRPMVAVQAKAQGAHAIISINASPYHQAKMTERQTIMRQRTLETSLPLIYVANVGGQDDIVYDGSSFAMDKNGKVQVQAPAFTEALVPVTLNHQHQLLPGLHSPLLSLEAEKYQAMVVGLRDYVNKNNFKGVILGVSGGIDSALVLAIAVDALGAERVHACLLPSRYTAQMSLDDGAQLCDNFKVSYTSISIEPVFTAFMDALAPSFTNHTADTTEENLQARCRASLLMALSNKNGFMLLSTGNKSEIAVGYCTLYGDMAGGYAPIKDIYKMEVYALTRYRNSLHSLIPTRIIERAPSAELAPNQTDQDTLPPYAVLDAILVAYLEHGSSVTEIAEQGYELDMVKRIINMVQRNEYKRKQAAPGPKISHCAFTRERRYPITCGTWMKK
jgi:NAD+ synthase (glutamine-hydrolysing)